jgi:hypothetical protein
MRIIYLGSLQDAPWLYPASKENHYILSICLAIDRWKQFTSMTHGSDVSGLPRHR